MGRQLVKLGMSWVIGKDCSGQDWWVRQPLHMCCYYRARRGPFLGNIDIDAWIRSCEEDLVCSDKAGRLFTSKKNLASVLEIWMIIHIIQNGIKYFCGWFCGRILGRFYRQFGGQLFLGLFFSALWAYFVYTLKECSGSFEDVSVNTTNYGRPVSRGLYQVKAY